MTQSITVACQLGPAYSASTISFKIFNVDGTQYADWTSSGFSQIGTTGTFLKANVSAPDAGGYIQFSADGGSTVLSTVADIPALGTLATAASIAALNNLSAAQVNAEVDAALADYDPPTYAELVAQIDAVQADIAALSIPDVVAIAARVLRYGVGNINKADIEANSLAQLIQAAFESDRDGGDWNIYNTDGTLMTTKDLTLDENADAVVGVS